jgi:GNAT superfamily N-acetyltransferase
MIETRKFTATDLEFDEIARVRNLVNHDSIDHPDYHKDDWKIRDKSLARDRLLLYDDYILIGVLYYVQGRNENQRTSFFNIVLDPQYNNYGYRELLYQEMLKKVKQFNCNKLFSNIYEHPNYKNYQKLLISHRFKLVQTNREYSCDIKQVDTKKYQPLIQKLESEGIKFYNSRDEMQKFPKHFQKLEELEWTLDQDIPIPDGIKHTRMPFEQWQKVCIDFYNNSYGVDIIAIKNGEYIGSTDIEVYSKTEPYKAWTGGLGVLKEFRRKGIATALKIKAIESLLKKGIKEIRTDNEENNPMYKINVSLGFKPVPFSLEYMKKI